MIKKVKSVNNPYAVIPKNISSNFTQILTILLQLPLCPQTLNAIVNGKTSKTRDLL